MDFKENITLNNFTIETGEIFYNSKQKTVLGMILYSRVDGIIKKIHYNILSDLLNHDSLFVFNSVKKINNELLRRFKKNRFCMDHGPHFKRKENLWNLLSYFKNIELNFFCEKHGKSPCDSHFPIVSRWIKEITSSKHIHYR
jgi:hypothetical protein